MSDNSFLKNIERRDFLKILSFTGAAGLVYPRNLVSKLTPAGTSRVIEVEDKNATKSLTINSDVVKIMVDSGIKELAQLNDAGEAWKSLLPGVGLASIIALKVNCLFTLCTHTEVTYAIAESLQKMTFGSNPYPANNIIIYDRSDSDLKNNGKYTINKTDTGVRCFGNNTSGYSTQTWDIADSPQKISKVVTEMCDYLINISVMKNHSGAGVTLCLKNHYGTCHNPGGSGGLHGGNFDSYPPALSAIEPIASKQKVLICDALFGVKQGGPSGTPQFTPNKILFSTDIVALDTYGRKILADNGCKTTNYATHIDKAATVYGLGTNNLSEIDIINILNPSESTGIEDNAEPSGIILEQNFPNPFSDITKISFHNDKYTHIELSIFDIEGIRVINLIDGMLEQGWHSVDWDGSDISGKSITTGLYIGRMMAGGESKSIIMQLVR